MLYHEAAWTYDAVAAAVSLGRWQAWGAAALPLLSGPRVLELGHGPGHMLARLAAHGYEAAGLDLSPQMGRMAARRLVRAGVRPRLVRGRAQDLPFAPGAFDGALAVFPTAYIVAPETITAVYRLLRPGGRLVVVPEAQLTGQGIIIRGIEWLNAITGQRVDNSGPARDDFWRGRLGAVGFAVAIEDLDLGHSAVTVVIAQRPSVS